VDRVEWYQERGYISGNPLLDPDSEMEILPLGTTITHEDGTPSISREIELSPLTGHHEDILTNRHLNAANRTMNLIMAGGQLPGVKKDVPGVVTSIGGVRPTESMIQRLSAGDRAYILLRARILSYPESPEHRFRCKCPFCSGPTFIWSQDLREVKCFAVPGQNEGQLLWDCVLPQSKKKVSFRILTGADDKKLKSYKRKYTGAQKAANYNSSLQTEIMRLQIQEVEGEERVTQTFLRSLSSWDRTFFRNETNRVSGGVESEILVECPSCNAESPVEFPMNQDFFFPAWI